MTKPCDRHDPQPSLLECGADTLPTLNPHQIRADLRDAYLGLPRVQLLLACNLTTHQREVYDHLLGNYGEARELHVEAMEAVETKHGMPGWDVGYDTEWYDTWQSIAPGLIAGDRDAWADLLGWSES